MAECPYPKHSIRMESEGLGKVCPWKASGSTAKNPHTHEDRTADRARKVKNSILDCVGNTPLVRCDNLRKAEGIKCNLLAKCEFLNPGGSVKDRIGRRMIIDAEETGRIKKGDILIEPTSGNTGIGLSMAAAVKGYQVIITMPEKMSQEKQDALKGLGSTIVRTPTEYAFDHKYSHIGIAGSLEEKLGRKAHVLDQYKNTGNPMAHYQETGQEIWDQTEGKIDYLFAGAGTGGTICGIARKLKERNPKIVVVGVDPEGSILAQPDSLNAENPPPAIGQQTEGVGYDFCPRVLDRTVVDEWMKSKCKDSFIMARRLLREEGFMCGGSSGTSMEAAVRYIKEHNIGADKTCVVVLPDNIRNYMTKHLNDDWMYERGYITEEQCALNNLPKHMENNDWGQDLTVKDLDMHAAYFLRMDVTCEEAINMMRSKGFDQFPVKEMNGVTFGVLTATNLLTRLGKRQVKLSDPIRKCVVRDLRHVSSDVTLNELVRILNRNSFVLIEDTYFITFSDIFDVLNPEPPKVSQAQFDLAIAQSQNKMYAAAIVGLTMGVLAAIAMKK